MSSAVSVRSVSMKAMTLWSESGGAATSGAMLGRKMWSTFSSRKSSSRWGRAASSDRMLPCRKLRFSTTVSVQAADGRLGRLAPGHLGRHPIMMKAADHHHLGGRQPGGEAQGMHQQRRAPDLDQRLGQLGGQ